MCTGDWVADDRAVCEEYWTCLGGGLVSLGCWDLDGCGNVCCCLVGSIGGVCLF